MNVDDLNLIRDAKHGNTEAFSRLVRNYYNFVYRTAYGVLQHNLDAEDVTQEVFIKVHQSLKRLREERTFPSWLARITVRTAIDSSQRAHYQRAGPLHEERDLPETAVHHNQSFAYLELEEALKKLSEAQRLILVLRELHGFNYEELSGILEIPIGTVRSRLHNARRQLRSYLD